MRTQFILIALLIATVPLSFINAPYPQELILQHTATVLGFACLAAAVVFANATKLSFTCVWIFLGLHIIGARWIYSYVPYDEMAKYLTGTTLSELFGWQRNHYDRLVHFASGLFGVPPASELLQKYAGMRPLGAALMGISCIMTIGALYEIIEWQIAVRLAPDQAEAYNGQQGDPWDPQKDMFFAWLGSMVSAVLICRWSPIANDR